MDDYIGPHNHKFHAKIANSFSREDSEMDSDSLLIDFLRASFSFYFFSCSLMFLEHFLKFATFGDNFPVRAIQ